jgi:hypothetical protein
MTATTTNITLFGQISVRIIQQQEMVIGPIAWTEAGKVSGLKVLDQKAGKVSIEGDPKEILGRLVAQYSRLFGRVSEEVCKEAAADLIVELPADQVPSSLK